MKNKKLIILLCFVLILVLITSVIFSLLYIGNNYIISGVSINHLNISEMSKENIHTKLSDLINQKNHTELKLEYTNEQTEHYEKLLDLSILNIEYDLEKGINDAYNLGRSENIFQNNFIILKTLLTKKNINLSLTYDDKMLNTVISDISSNLPNKLIQSSYYVEDDNLIITRGKAGYIVDENLFKNLINTYLLDFSSDKTNLEIPVKFVQPENIDLDKIHSEIYKEAKDAYFEKSPFEVHSEVKGVNFDLEKAQKFIDENPDSTEYTINLKITKPKIKLNDLDINIFPDKLSTFSTRYDITNEDRTTNLNLAAKKINETILSPGEEFSYNKIVGERSIAAGYKEAKVYQGGQIIDGLGGGICQISSTLYNAVVFANLKVTQRFNHQFTTSYVPAGRDATVAYGVKDFKFLNDRTYPIKINVSINSGIAKVDIYGITEKDDYTAEFDIETVSNIPRDTKYEIDSSLPEGTEKIKQQGSDGIIVNAYKILKKNGITISRELISKDKYNPLDKIILTSSKNAN